MIEEKIDALKKKYSKMIVEDKSHLTDTFPIIRQALSGLYSIASEDVETYNKALDTYFQEYAEFMKNDFESQNRRNRILKLVFVISNKGNVPADDIDIFLSFPQNMLLMNIENYPGIIYPPKPPIKPEPGKFQIPTIYTNPIIGNIDLIQHKELSILNVSNNEIDKIHAIAHFHIEKVKHGLGEYSQPLYVEFKSHESAVSFHIEYKILAANIPSEIAGQLHVVINK